MTDLLSYSIVRDPEIEGGKIVTLMFIDGLIVTVPSDFPDIDAVVKALLREDVEKVRRLVAPLVDTNLVTGIDGLIYNNGLFLDGRPLPRQFSDYLLWFLEEYGEIPERFVRFARRVLRAPNEFVKETLWRFLEHRQVRILEDGSIQTYKAVKEVDGEFFDYYTGTVHHVIGVPVTVPKHRIDPDPANTCSFGLHSGTLTFARDEYRRGASDKVILLMAVPPERIYAVASDSEWQKVRSDYQLPTAVLPEHLWAEALPITPEYDPGEDYDAIEEVIHDANEAARAAQQDDDGPTAEWFKQLVADNADFFGEGGGEEAADEDETCYFCGQDLGAGEDQICDYCDADDDDDVCDCGEEVGDDGYCHRCDTWI